MVYSCWRREGHAMSLDRRGKYPGSIGSPQHRATGTPGKRTLTESLVAPAARRPIQTAPADPRGQATPAAVARAAAPPSSAGERVPAGVRPQMEQALGADFSAVRIHAGPEAQAIGALAYAQGTDLHFAPGQYQPDSPRGQELLGHELTHVMQQARGRVSAPHQAKGGSIHNDPALEREADERGASAARRKP